MLTTCTHCGAEQDASSTHCFKCGQMMFSMNMNPYASPATMSPVETPFAPQYGLELAGRFERFVAQLADGFLNLAAALPGIIVVVAGMLTAESQEEPGPLFYIGLVIAVMGSLGLNIYQWILISRDGQSFGKRWLKIRIVKCDTRQPPGFVYGVLLRLWVNGILSGLPCGIGLVYTLVDLCFIFREDRRCVHDLLAQTVVINA